MESSADLKQVEIQQNQQEEIKNDAQVQNSPNDQESKVQTDKVNKEVKPSKSQIAKDAKKMKKKVAQAVTVIVKAENQSFEQLVTKEPVKQVLVSHFGNGDEEDQNVIYEFASKFGSLKKITIFPGTSYGHLEFENDQDVADMMANMDGPNIKILKFYGKDRHVAFFPTPVKFQELKNKATVDFPQSTNAFSGIIPGLYVFDDFITQEEEDQMIMQMDKHQWIKLLNRRVQHYGYEFIYGTNTVDKNSQIGPLPDFCSFLIPKFEKILKNFGFNNQSEVIDLDKQEEEYKEDTFEERFGMFDQLTINDYTPGQGIPPHVDTHSPFQEIFVSLSLLSGVSMNFRTPEGQQKDVYLIPRSLVLFSGEARYNYLHSIATRKLDSVEGLLKFRHRRVSLTFRKIKQDACTCRFPKLCDTQNKEANVDSNKLAGEGEEAKIDPANLVALSATDMEKKHVYEVYDKIAPHFSNTRYKPWPKIQKYMESLPVGSLNIDVGCGNGKYLGCNKDNVFSIGTDRSINLLGICRDRGEFQTFYCDSLKLPVRDQTFNSCISIAVIHHFSTKTLRVAALNEMHRILKIGGKVLVYVWAFEQEVKKFSTQDVFVPWHLQDTYEEGNKQQDSQNNSQQNIVQNNADDHLHDDQVEENKSQSSSSFIETGLRNDEKKATVYHRYYHMFKEGELEELFTENFQGRFEIKERYYDHANWAVICEKVSN